MHRINFLTFRKLAYPFIAVVFNLSRLIPFRNKKIWIYGESSGNYYVDNTKYLFEFACTQKDEIKHVWITNNKSILKKIKSNNHEAYLQNSAKALWLQLRCGVAIYNKGLDDISKIPVFGGATIVSTWHGAGFKHIYNATYTGLQLKLKKICDFLFCWTKMDLLLATSEYQCKQFLERFSIKRNQMAITGQPRNDYFQIPNTRFEILQKLNISQDKKIILYMPTYRSKFQGEGIENNIINEIINHRLFREYIDHNNCIFAIKLHPMTKSVCIPENGNFRLLEHGGDIDTQQLLSIADILITDYSSCFVDYALLHRPIVFYIPDKDDYVKYVGGMDKEFYDFMEYGCANNVEELVSALKNPSLKIADAANNLFYAPETGNSFSENVYNAIKSKVFK